MDIDQTKSNPRAASARIEPRKPGEYKGQRKHDLRIGKQPAYVDAARADLNRVLLSPPTPWAIQKICAERRGQRETQRAMKSGTTCAYIGVITFGTEAQRLFLKLEIEEQNAAYLETAERIAERLNTTLEGLVVHMDEAAPHAHLTFPAYDLDGQPLTKTVKFQALLDVQDIVAEVMGRHAPGIERGQSRRARIEAGATVAETMHRTVRQLHDDLPAEIAAKEAELAQASARVDEMRVRVEDLERKAQLTDKEAKRLEVYRARLADRVAVEEAAKTEAERLARVAQDEAAIARQERDEAQGQEAAARIKATRITAAIQVLADEISADTISRDDAGKLWANDPDGLRQGFPDLKPAVIATADAMTAKRKLASDAAADRKKATDALAIANAASADAVSLRTTLKGTLALLRLAISRVSRHLSKDERAKVDQVVKQAERLIKPEPLPAAAPAVEESNDDSRVSM